ncbi:hypothetical protein [Spiroplasma endosymbiont of Crioceris asparagi]|uniref:hypothetical protein n=1 Tax=Spiroplasma endosymbiont of Crioceris asparagi TaxID=3066286 RepID=UPI0030CD7187
MKKYLKEKENIVKKYFKHIKWLYFIHCLDIILFILILGLFISLTAFSHKEKWVSYTIVTLGVYFLIKFTLSNWLSRSLYYYKIQVFNLVVNFKDAEINLKRNVDITSFWFIAMSILINMLTAFMMQWSTKDLIDNKIWESVVFVLLNLMLLPSFLNSFQELISVEKGVDSRFINLLKNQYFLHKNIFNNAIFDENNINLVFEEINLKSKEGIFIVKPKNFEKINYEIFNKMNEKILNNYKELWDFYWNVLDLKQKTKVKYWHKIKLKRIEKILDAIFIDFFEL